ncbi:MAG: hypothetical protein MJD61_17955 [Proteobacteria bacterium]|nr:hypothetical protein [Pseudomonadota bacterium]
MVGARAMAVLGRRRATRDINILVQPTASNASRPGLALAGFGFPEYAKAAKEHFKHLERMAILGREPVRIDILSSIAGISFEEAWSGRVSVTLEGIEVGFLGLAQICATKRAANRPKDQLDLALLDELEVEPGA